MATRRTSIERIDLSSAHARALLDRVRPKLTDEEFRELKALVDTLVYLAELVAHTTASIARVRTLLFGTGSTEKTRDVLARAGLPEASPAAGAPDASGSTDRDRPPDPTADRPPSEGRPRGHGRHGAAAYSGAARIRIPHPSLKTGDPCPACDGGKVYVVREPTVLVRFVGQAPIGATVYTLEKLRCHLCGATFTAPPPAGGGTEKYDARTGAMIALLKYGSGVPFFRLARLQAQAGVPLPASTQWGIVAHLATQLRPVHAELIRQAADGEVVYNDDTSMTVLSLLEPSPPASTAAALPDHDEVAPTRTGVFTSGIVATTRDGHRVALYVTGRRHAGENLAAVLAHRASGREPPIQMCDALSRNVPKGFAVVLAHCLCHARRHVVDVAPNFPEESRYILETFRDVYRHDAQARERRLTPEARLAFHQTHSRPRMDALHTWLDAQLDEHRVEPNSGLGQAIRHLLKHWTPLTRFLEVAGAPLDSNLVERALKRAILHRKASLFYKTPNGAHVGDLFMAIVHTCELNGVEAFEYLTVLQLHLDAIKDAPGAWLPWTYRHTIRQLSPALPASA